jgi:hypothetical protein
MTSEKNIVFQRSQVFTIDHHRLRFELKGRLVFSEFDTFCFVINLLY